MATYYISEYGSDSNNGLGPDPTHGTNMPWLTIGKALASGSPVVAGDTVYIGPGRLNSTSGVVVLSTISSAVSPTVFAGDPLNVQGFKDGSGDAVAPGICWITMRTSGQDADTPASSGTVMFTLTTNNPEGLTFRNLFFDGRPGNSTVFSANANAGGALVVEDCGFCCNTVHTFANASVATAGRNVTFRRNLIVANFCFAYAGSNAAATANADLGLLWEGNLIVSAFGTGIAFSSSGGNLAGGMTIRDNTFINTENSFFSTTALRVSTTTPITVSGNLFLGVGLLNAGTSGHVVDGGYNRWIGNTGSNTNVTAAGTSAFGALPNLVTPLTRKWGLTGPRDDVFGWLDAALVAQRSAGDSTAIDFRGRTARPWGAGASSGYMQHRNVTQDATSAITGGGTNSLKLTGAGEVSVWVPVDAESTTLSITTKSTSYGGTNWPQMIVVANPSIGVTEQTATASSATEAAISTSAFTPTAKGVVEVRLISRSTSTSSTTHFDLLTA